jgi:hypothetical protein
VLEHLIPVLGRVSLVAAGRHFERAVGRSGSRTVWSIEPVGDVLLKKAELFEVDCGGWFGVRAAGVAGC